MTSIKVAYFGHPGSFSLKAARRFLRQNGLQTPYLFPCQSMQEVLDYVLIGGCYGVIPYYNNNGGSVKGHGSLNTKYKDLIIDDIELPVHHYLMCRKGVRVSDITQIASHPQALRQCQTYLEERYPGIPHVKYSTTSTAAYDLAHGELPKTAAVIASKEAGNKYRLKLLDSRIEDNENNITHFKILLKPAAKKQ